MKNLKMLTLALAILLSGCAEVMQIAQQTLEGETPLTQSEIIAGLKEALVTGTNNSVSILGAQDGYYKDELVKIMLPPEADIIVENAGKVPGGQKLLDDVGIGQYAEHRPAHLSGGQMQRLGIARALVHMPKVIFADEPTGALDSHVSKEIMDLFIRLNQEEGITIIIITHDEKIAQQCSRHVIMEDGVWKKECWNHFFSGIRMVYGIVYGV